MSFGGDFSFVRFEDFVLEGYSLEMSRMRDVVIGGEEGLRLAQMELFESSWEKVETEKFELLRSSVQRCIFQNCVFRRWDFVSCSE